MLKICLKQLVRRDWQIEDYNHYSQNYESTQGLDRLIQLLRQNLQADDV